MRRKPMFSALLAFMLMAFAAHAAGDVLYSTLGPSGQYDSANGWYVDGANYDNQALAMPFTPDESNVVYGARLALGNYAGGNSPINLYIYDDNYGIPGGTQLGILQQQGTILPFSQGGGLVWFRCVACPEVTVGTQYWLVAVETDPNTEQAWFWAYHDQFGSFAFNQFGSETGPWNPITDFVTGFDIETFVPEPGTFAMMGTGVLVAGGTLRRKLRF